MWSKKGFTMIELMAVNVVLVVVAIVSTLIIVRVTNDLKKGAVRDSAQGIIKAGELKQTEEVKARLIGPGTERVYTETSGLNYRGKKGTVFEVVLDKEGRAKFEGFIDGYCVVKDFFDEDVSIDKTKKKVDDCVTRNIKASYLIRSKNKKDNQEGLFTDDFGNTRYRGNATYVKNYVVFNKEIWRIIGVFNGKVKIIKTDGIGNQKWDTKGPYGLNNWPTSTLSTYLNGDYLVNMDEKARNMVVDATYYLGGWNSISETKRTLYEKERGTVTTNCVVGTNGENDNVCPRSTTWVGKIGLAYASDYGYAAGSECNTTLDHYNESVCSNNNWMLNINYHQWFITPSSLNTTSVWGVSNTGAINNQYNVNGEFIVQPTLFLDPDVRIIDGDGTQLSPYQLK